MGTRTMKTLRARGVRATALAALMALTGLAVGLSPRTAWADAPAVDDPVAEEARVHHRRGIALYDEGDLRLALVELERAYAIGKSYKVLFNIGQVHLQAGNHARARVVLERYLAEGGAAIAAARRRDVEADLAMLRMRTATLTLRVNVPDADVSIDDAPAGKAPLEGAIVSAGTLRVQVTKPGFHPRTREITLAGGDAQTVAIELDEARPDVLVTQSPGGVPGPAVASWLVTGLLAAGTVGTGIAAIATSSKYDAQREAPISGSPEEARADLERQRSVVKGLALTTDILAVSTLLGAGLSLYLTFRPRPGPHAARLRVQGLGASFTVGF